MERASDELQAYAVAAWHRFDQDITDRLLRAVAGSFALIACADGELSQSEVDGMVQAVIQSEKLPKVDAKQLETSFRDLCQALFTDVEGGRERALQAVRAVAEDREHAELVARAAQLAMHADDRVRAPEQTALRQLCEALELDPEAFS